MGELILTGKMWKFCLHPFYWCQTATHHQPKIVLSTKILDVWDREGGGSPPQLEHMLFLGIKLRPLSNKALLDCIFNFSHLISLVLCKGQMMMMAIELRLIPDVHNVNCNERIEWAHTSSGPIQQTILFRCSLAAKNDQTKHNISRVICP